MQERKNTFLGDNSGERSCWGANRDLEGPLGSNGEHLTRAASAPPTGNDPSTNSAQVPAREDSESTNEDEIEAPLEEFIRSGEALDRDGSEHMAIDEDESSESAPPPPAILEGKGKGKATSKEPTPTQEAMIIDETESRAATEVGDAGPSSPPMVKNTRRTAQDTFPKTNTAPAKKRHTKPVVETLAGTRPKRAGAGERFKKTGTAGADGPPADAPATHEKSGRQPRQGLTEAGKEDARKLKNKNGKKYGDERTRNESKTPKGPKATGPTPTAARRTSITIDDMTASIIAAVDGAVGVAQLFSGFLEIHADAFGRAEAEQAQGNIDECLQGLKRDAPDVDDCGSGKKTKKTK